MAFNRYAAQVNLLVRILPLIADEVDFALKGGTAINLFYRDMPRLSIDLDLTYLPVQPREETLERIASALTRIQQRIERLPGARVTRSSASKDFRLDIRQGGVLVKIEVSPVMRGTVHQVQFRRVTSRVEEQFGFAEVQVVAFEDLYAGKLVAALDRQHPRDLYDVGLLYEYEGLADDLFRTFLVYIASSNRPSHELLNPNPIEITSAFHAEFQGMTNQPVTLEHLHAVRERLFSDTRERLDSRAKSFLLSLHDGNPDFESLGLPQARSLPAVTWKLLNLQKLREENQTKFAEQRVSLEELFSS